VKFCSKCKKAYADKQNFCNKCGVKLVEEPFPIGELEVGELFTKDDEDFYKYKRGFRF
jgi:predicted amidophosphoribosyltransferase